jgi:hypothetical protein
MGSYIFNFGEWDLYKNSGQEYLYSIDSYDIENNILKSKNNIEIDMKTLKTEWEGKLPYCVEIVTGDKSEIHYIDSSRDFCVIILTDDSKAVVIDKDFRNSIFVKLFLKKSGTEYLESIYKKETVNVWQPFI